MTNYADEEWEEIGRQWRQAAGRDQDVRFEAPAFVRWLKHAGYIKDYICVADSDLSSEGKYEPDEARIYFRESTWAGAFRRVPHHVWTLVHEGAHGILKHKETRLRIARLAHQPKSRRGGQDELDANRLTASIIAPFDKADFKPEMSVEDIQDRFGLSHLAATKRLEEFQRIHRRKHGIQRPLPPGIIDFLAAQKRKGHKVTSLDGVPELPPRPVAKYEGDACPNCSKFTLVRKGLTMVCDTCDARTGDD